MELEKVKKYLQVYLDDIIVPQLNSELVGDDDEPITVKVHDIKIKEHIPSEAVVFLDMNPDWSKGSITRKFDEDIRRFLHMIGFNKLTFVAWNQRTQSIYEPK